MTRVPVIISSTVADYDMVGMAKSGVTIVTIHLTPSLCIASIDGDEDYDGKIAKWIISPAHSRRVSAVATWQMADYITAGNA